MKIVFALLATMPLALLACSKDEPSDGGKMAPSGTMASGGAMKPAPGAGHM